ncbi:hypothetical protein PV10_05244 [Exophiala mesophila]|uniref:Uncharacterized protein n=1 Tax=Exophiala mesophila TaxID=212818 RepID=A0A0D2A521_EXOME|nr:uncharacterized protein PV10_05244 [Exophiala mesophila]KIV94088.1 hypothetical protein PV10_05244 [Exophiala mesophila]
MALQGIRGYAPLNLNAGDQTAPNPSQSPFEVNTAYDPADISQRGLSPRQSFRFTNSLPPASSPPSKRLDTEWNPFFLRKWVLLCFALFFALVIASLQILYSVSRKNDGIATSDGGKHYLWTYGPTALFVVVTVLWRQVDYAAKSIQPWAELAKGPQPANNSLLLDYVTPLQIVAFWKSLRNRHFVVASTILVFVLVKVITVASTGIFSLQAVPKNNIATVMALNNTFDASDFQHAAAVDTRPAYIVYGHREYNNTLPIGTTDSYAVQIFAPNNGFVNGSITYTAEVDVFSAAIDCETGTLTYVRSYDSRSNAPVASYYNTSISLPDCEVFNAYLDAPDWYYQQNDTQHRFGYRGTFQNVTCTNLPEDDPTRERYLIAFTYSEGVGQNNNTMLNSSNVVCKPRYSLETATVTINPDGQVVSVVPTGKSRNFSDFTAGDIGLGVFASVSQTYALAVSGEELVLDPFTSLMQQDTVDFENPIVLDTQYLNTTGNRIFTKVAAQVANMYLLKQTSGDSRPTVEGLVSKHTNRLVVQQTPVRVMQGVAATMLILSLVMAFATPRGVVPRSVDSIVAIAAILARSPQLERQLRETGHMDMNELASLLSPYMFWTKIDNDNDTRTFSIQMASKLDNNFGPNPTSQEIRVHGIKWTRPFVLRRIAIFTTILLSIAAIITLEILLSRSQANNGLANVGNNTSTRYSWLYIPMIVFLLLGTLFNIMDFEIEFNESYHALSKGFCDAQSSMLWYPLRHVSFHATWNGLKHSRFALTAASASAILAPFLTIVVAGLFSARATLHTSPIDVDALDWFNSTGSPSSSSSELPSLVIQGNMSYPSFTFDELAFPRLAVAGDADVNGTITVNTPALRAGVICTPVPESRILEAQVIDDNYLETNISTPDGCGNSGRIEDPVYYFLTNNLQVPINASGYFGDSLSLGFEENCPTIALYYGHVTDNAVDEFIAVLCTQFIERVDAELMLTVPDLDITSPATVVPDSAANYSDWHESFPSFQTINITGTKDVFSSTFNALVYGRDGVPQEELLNATNLITGYTHLYRQYVAQVLNLYFRSELSSLPANESEVVVNPLVATLDDFNHFRLVQSPLSTHLLVGVLSVLTICALVMLITVDMRHVLPKPVGSVAAVASLLAGSTLVDERSGLIPKGSEFWSDEKWDKAGIWQGQMFRMGYWNKFQEPVDSNSRVMLPTFGDSDTGMREDGELTKSYRIDARQKMYALTHIGSGQGDQGQDDIWPSTR